MTISLKYTEAVSALAECLYGFLPASGAIFTFAEAAAGAGVSECWPGVKEMSKMPAIERLLGSTFTNRRDRFCPLILEIVNGGLAYRRRRGNPIIRAEIDSLNRLLLRFDFQIPELHDREFLALLEGSGAQVSTPPASSTTVAISCSAPSAARSAKIDHLRQQFLQLQSMIDRQGAGLQLEVLLNELFEIFGLSPREPFRVRGEQIDGSFYFEKEFYLLEAKWTKDPTGVDALYSFKVKVEGKSQFTRGLLLSVNGFSVEAVAAITSGKTPNFVMLDGSHLYRVLEGHLSLIDVLLRSVRALVERGRPYAPLACP